MDETLCYTARFIQPFLRLLREYPGYHDLSFSRLEAVAPDDRIPIVDGYGRLREAINLIKIADIGLKAGSMMCVGSAGALDYVIQSAATVGEAGILAGRYSRLYSDAIEPTILVNGKRAYIRLNSKVPWIRAVADFTMSFSYSIHIRAQLRDDPSAECWFEHPKPVDTSEYERVFTPAKLSFGAPFYGFAFNADYLQAPLASGDMKTHAVLRAQVDVTLEGLLQSRGVTARVREFLNKGMTRGDLSAHSIARQLRMSQRTMLRRLENESTSFSEELDKLRRQLAFQYLKGRELSLVDVAFLLGFSHQSAFHRAFKRWTGKTPLQYRSAEED